jgi:hypothetical protein
MRIRFRGVPLLSWLALSALLAGIGLATALSNSSGTGRMAIGFVLVAVGLACGVRACRVAVVTTADEVYVRNLFRSFRVPLAELAELRSRVVGTPLTRVVGWGQLELRDRRGTSIPIAATTGMRHDDLAEFIRALTPDGALLERNVDDSVFPTVHGSSSS